MSQLRSNLKFASLTIGLALVLAGCGVQLAGSAAVIDNVRVSEKELNEQISELKVVLEQAPNAPLGEQVARGLLARLIVNEVVLQAANAEDVTVSDSEVARERKTIEEAFGGPDALVLFAANQGLPPGMIDGALRTDLLTTRLGQKLSPGVEPALQQEVAFAFVSEYAGGLRIEVSPRIGVWVVEDFSIAPPPNDLSVPAQN